MIEQLRADHATLSKHFNNDRDMKIQETEVLQNQVTTLSPTEQREEHTALREQLKGRETVKDGKAVALRISDINTIISQESSEYSVSADSQKQLELQATEEISKLTKQLSEKDAYLDAAYTELYSIKRD